jgi:Ca2+-binding RTX toxin-like protein
VITAKAFYDDGLNNNAAPIMVTVNNVAPTANAGGPYIRTDETAFVLNGSADDPGVDDILTFTWDLDGDGNFGETGAGAERGDEVGASPTFDPTGIVGTVNVTLRVDDGDGGIDDDVAQITMQADGVFLDELTGILSVIDTNAANDTVTVTQSGGSISVNVNGNISSFNVSEVNEIEISLGSGNDSVTIASGIVKPVTIDGGAGNDVLIAGNGPSTLLGGAGNDLLFGGNGTNVLVGGDGVDGITGGTGRDVLIGGAGSDAIVGGSGEDILIGGSTVHDADLDALDDIMATWGSGGSFSSRIAALTTGPEARLRTGINATVSDDNSLDVILGVGLFTDSGSDLVFGDASTAGDGVRDILLLSLLDVLIPVN